MLGLGDMTVYILWKKLYKIGYFSSFTYFINMGNIKVACK